jgi:hypothetical protein
MMMQNDGADNQSSNAAGHRLATFFENLGLKPITSQLCDCHDAYQVERKGGR